MRKGRDHREIINAFPTYIVMRELEYMVEHEVSIRKCEICRRYFLPHSKASRYCDRLVDDHAGKTCQDIGAMTKYQEKINGDLAKKLYIKVDNRIQTWVGRHKENGLYRLKYLKWKDEAKQCLED